MEVGRGVGEQRQAVTLRENLGKEGRNIGPILRPNPTPEYRDKDENNSFPGRHSFMYYYSVLPGCRSSDIITGEDELFRYNKRTLSSPVSETSYVDTGQSCCITETNTTIGHQIFMSYSYSQTAGFLLDQSDRICPSI